MSNRNELEPIQMRIARIFIWTVLAPALSGVTAYYIAYYATMFIRGLL